MQRAINSSPLKSRVNAEVKLGRAQPDDITLHDLLAKYEALGELYDAALTELALNKIQLSNDYNEIAKLKAELATTTAELNSLKPNTKPLF
jgi:hypothetical protein